MGGLMSQKEVERAQTLDLLRAGKVNPRDAAQRIGVSLRHLRRLARRYQGEGLAGLASKQRGTPSNRRLGDTVRARVIELIGAHYRDFGPTLASETLAERHGLHLSVESTRQIMIQAGYRRAKKGSTVRTHPMRARRARFGELIQIDGSPHDWFEGRGDYFTLLVFIDDATGRLTHLRFAPAETTLGYMRVLHDHIVAHGVPVALYSDKHSIFRINAKDANPDAETQFSRAARELGIECIHAHSPQAKGRVERANQTLQDRLVKAMRLAGINDPDAANAWLPGYIADHNQRFAVESACQEDAHRVYAHTPDDRVRTLSVQTTRTLSKNLACQHDNLLFQVEPSGTGLGLRGAHVTVHEHFNGTKHLYWRTRKLAFKVMEKPLRQARVADSKAVNARVDDALGRRSTAHTPAPDHPWRNYPPVAP